MNLPEESNQRLPSLPKYPQSAKSKNQKTLESDRYSFYDPQQEEVFQGYDISNNKNSSKSREYSASRDNFKSKGSSSYRSLSIDAQKQNPGPGAYIPNYDSIFPTSSKQTIPRSPRDLNDHEKRPGPGYYEPNGADIFRRRSNGNTKFSLDKRKFFNLKREYDVGPGQYTIDTSFTLNKSLSNTQSVAFTKSERNLTKSPESTEPGPGQYNPKRLREARNTLFPQSRTDDSTSMYAPKPFIIPGAGTYTINSKIMQQGPRAVFSSEKRFYVKDKAIPAPNSYQIPSKFDQYICKDNDTSYRLQNRSNDQLVSRQQQQQQQLLQQINNSKDDTSQQINRSKKGIQAICIDQTNHNDDDDTIFKQKIFTIKNIKLQKKVPLLIKSHQKQNHNNES